MDSLYKTASTILYTFKLVPAQHSSWLSKHASLSPNIWGSHSYQHTWSITIHPRFLSVFPLLQQSKFKSALYHPLSLCYISFPHPQSLSALFFFTWTSAESWRCNTVHSLLTGPSSNLPFPHRSFWILVPLQHCSSTMGRFFSWTLSKTHYCRFSCISAEACWGSTPCVRAGRWGSRTSAGSWVWRFWRRGPRWCMSACTHPSGNTGWSWCGHGKNWS